MRWKKCASIAGLTAFCDTSLFYQNTFSVKLIKEWPNTNDYSIIRIQIRNIKIAKNVGEWFYFTGILKLLLKTIADIKRHFSYHKNKCNIKAIQHFIDKIT